MAWSVSSDGSVMTIVVALKLPAHSVKVTQWLRTTKRPSGEWSPLFIISTAGISRPLTENEQRALLRAAQKELRRAISEIAKGAVSSL